MSVSVVQVLILWPILGIFGRRQGRRRDAASGAAVTGADGNTAKVDDAAGADGNAVRVDVDAAAAGQVRCSQRLAVHQGISSAYAPRCRR